MFESWTYPAPAHGLALRGWLTPPSGKPLLHFLHGNGFCGRTYEPMLRHLATDFDLWLTDLQGHGDSDAGAAFIGWNGNAGLARAAFDAHRQRFGPVPAFAAGHSFGGVLTALMLAAADQPFSRAVLLDPVLFPRSMLAAHALLKLIGRHRNTRLARGARRRRLRWPDRNTAFRALRGRGVYRGWTDEALRAYVDHALRDDGAGTVELKCPPSIEAEVFSSCPRGLWPALRRIAVPTLIVHGDATMPFVRQSAARAATLNPRIRRQQVVGDHCFMQQDPATAAALVRNFLLDAGAAAAVTAPADRTIMAPHG